MTILKAIQELEALAPAASVVPALREQNRNLTIKLDEFDRDNRSLEGKIVLDPKLDPDPYGNFGISLVDRLQAMGWPL